MSERESICTRGKSLSWRERVVKKEDKIFIFHCGQAVPILGGAPIKYPIKFSSYLDMWRWLQKDLCWWRLLRVPWTARRSYQSILKELNPKYWLQGLMLKLKLQYFGHLMQRTDSLEKTLMLGKIEGRMRRGDRGWDGWMSLLTQWTWVWANCGRW